MKKLWRSERNALMINSCSSWFIKVFIDLSSLFQVVKGRAKISMDITMVWSGVEDILVLCSIKTIRWILRKCNKLLQYFVL